MSTEIHYLIKVVPLLFTLAVGGTLLGLLLGAILWWRGKVTARRIQRETKALRDQIARARREASK